MKKIFIGLMVLSMVSFVFLMDVSAAKNKGKKAQKSKVDTPLEKKVDINKDGVVNKSEVLELKEKKNEKVDLNKDKVVERRERMLGWKDGSFKANTLEKKYDKNSDGWIDTAEARELLKDRYEIIKTQGKAKVDTAVEREYDANKDGIIDSNEAKAMGKDVGE